ncbi:MAG: hypothetical protein IIW93_06860 [Bacteroidaceae bacterium]|nr:hypothetical protein [Bacteroidaceae bacterium]
MKKFAFLFLATFLAVSCSKFDDSEIWDKLNDHEYRIAYLEEVCKKINADIINLQTIVTALESNDYIVNATTLADGSGQLFIFKSGKSVVIYNGKDGKDASVPTISVKKDSDGFYYWTIDGAWLLVDDEKVRASAKDGKDGVDGTNGKDGVDGTDGKDGVDGTDGIDGVDGKDGVDGADGKDGITPQFKIENGYWFISYDNGINWTKLGKATGSNGLDGIDGVNGSDGADGDSMFKRVFEENGYVCFEMNDEASTIIRIPLMKDGTLVVTVDKEGTLSRVLTSEQTRTTTALTIKGHINTEDMRYIQVMNSLHKLDLSEAEYNCSSTSETPFVFVTNPYQDTLVNRTLQEIIFPKMDRSRYMNISYCLALKKITINSDKMYLENYRDANKITEFCPNVATLEYAEGVTDSSCEGVWNSASSLDTIIYPSTLVNIPTSLTKCPPPTFDESNGYYKTILVHTIPCNTLICKAENPPVVSPDAFAYGASYIKEHNGYTVNKVLWKVEIPEGAVLYVPKKSINLYKEAPLWRGYKNIKAIEEM